MSSAELNRACRSGAAFLSMMRHKKNYPLSAIATVVEP
jgi:hypothetical protein